MNWALHPDKHRVKPSYTGQRATCIWCCSELIAKCGEIYTWHWQHAPSQNCDSWKEFETEWHRKWKAHFPDHWQEVIIDDGLEKHIADVRTSSGLVIEFQNSSISKATINIREAFYGKMIWVINAASFKENFSMRSIVKTKLRRIDEMAAERHKMLAKDIGGEKQRLQQRITDLEEKAADLLDDIKYSESDRDCLKEELEGLYHFAGELIQSFTGDRYFGESYNREVVNQAKSLFRDQYIALQEEKQKQQYEINRNKNTLNEIQKLEPICLEGKDFKVINFNQITKANFHNVKAVLKTSRYDLFPQVTDFVSDLVLMQFKYKQHDYHFAIDPADVIQKYQGLMTDAEQQLQSLLLQEDLMRIELTNTLKKLFVDKIEEHNNTIESCKVSRESVLKQCSEAREYYLKALDALKTETEEMTAIIEKETKNDRFKAMREHKGRYTFVWKHERKSWQDATAPIFFDTGDGFLFEKKSDKLFQKISVEEFLAAYL